MNEIQKGQEPNAYRDIVEQCRVALDLLKKTKTAKSARQSTDKPATIHDQNLCVELEVSFTRSPKNTPTLTTAQGGPVCDDQNTLKIGERGPTLIEDFHFREKIFHFDHEQIPERVVHARGYCAHGYFETYESLTKYIRLSQARRAPSTTHLQLLSF